MKGFREEKLYYISNFTSKKPLHINSCFLGVSVTREVILANEHYLLGSVLLFADLFPFALAQESSLGERYHCLL